MEQAANNIKIMVCRLRECWIADTQCRFLKGTEHVFNGLLNGKLASTAVTMIPEEKEIVEG